MTEKLKIAFMGTPDFAVPILNALIGSETEVVDVYTKQPRARGRGQKVQPTSVQTVSEKLGVPVYTPASLRNDKKVQQRLINQQLDAIIVAAYGLMLPKSILEAPRFGCLNVHASLLPRWRGAAPIQYAIWKGDEKTGITIMKMEEGLDSGPIIAQSDILINQLTTAQSLHDELSMLGSKMIVDVLKKAVIKGHLASQEQDESFAVYAPTLKKEDGRIDWTETAQQIDCKVRALNPWPGVWTTINSQTRLKILKASPYETRTEAATGTLINAEGLVSCGNHTTVQLVSVQPENCRPMDFLSALNGGHLLPEMVLV